MIEICCAFFAVAFKTIRHKTKNEDNKQTDLIDVFFWYRLDILDEQLSSNNPSTMMHNGNEEQQTLLRNHTDNVVATSPDRTPTRSTTDEPFYEATVGGEEQPSITVIAASDVVPGTPAARATE